MTEQLYHHIQKIVPGFDVEEQKLHPFFHTRSVKKDEILLREKDICTDIYFINKGGLYLYYENNNYKQVIHFGLENWWITDYKAFPDGKPAFYAIAAMEDSEITSINRKDYETLLLQFPLLSLYFNRLHERAYGAALLKQKTFATLSKKDFYLYFRNTYPELRGRIPDAIFASYMGVPVEHLKKFRGEEVS